MRVEERRDQARGVVLHAAPGHDLVCALPREHFGRHADRPDVWNGATTWEMPRVPCRDTEIEIPLQDGDGLYVVYAKSQAVAERFRRNAERLTRLAYDRREAAHA